MPVAPAEQARAKLAMVLDLLSSTGVAAGDVRWTASPRSVGYRNRIRLKIEEGGRVRFFNDRKAPSCIVLEPALHERLGFVLELSTREPERFAPFAHLELRSPDLEGLAGLAFAGSAAPRPLDGFLVGLRGDPAVPCQRRRVADTTWTFVPLDGFLQVNTEVNEALVRAVVRGATARAAGSALDLFAGSGNFSVPLAQRGVRVTAVETHAPSVRALVRAAEQQGVLVEAFDEPARDACVRFAAGGRSFELVVVDAPRAGAGPTLPAIVALRPRVVALCSCNPESLARDTGALGAAGFTLDELDVLDMFPHTRHCEVLAWFVR